jgi:AraC-like DNA-binding protein
MSIKRQKAIRDPRGLKGNQLTTLGYDYPSGFQIPEHFHAEDQLVFASQGVMTVKTDQGVWVVPPLKAVWIPSGTVHAIGISGQVRMRTLYFAKGFIRNYSSKCTVMHVSSLMRELILYACKKNHYSTKIMREKYFIEVIVEHLRIQSKIPMQIPLPSDQRALRFAKQLLSNPKDQRSVKEICADMGLGVRTIERIFEIETSLSVGRWRQQLRIIHAAEMVAAGIKVTSIALDVGYNSPSAFISAFKKVMNCTPGQFGNEETSKSKNLI